MISGEFATGAVVVSTVVGRAVCSRSYTPRCCRCHGSSSGICLPSQNRSRLRPGTDASVAPTARVPRAGAGRFGQTVSAGYLGRLPTYRTVISTSGTLGRCATTVAIAVHGETSAMPIRARPAGTTPRQTAGDGSMSPEPMANRRRGSGPEPLSGLQALARTCRGLATERVWVMGGREWPGHTRQSRTRTTSLCTA